ncbi:phytoene desaturase family protein [Bacillus sp. CHD6a]|uniref:phytoene desaturase family protein n=1 Tax=Bacillus sp. CHD6a TaxID=1643452 RepID=UPI0006CD1E5D|nr:FAD-dependent oxidoreductase [Bacillus sp. CHD6a]KPB03005.1 phytoene dehydrogenase [Bacillus sp. CHD6a]
MLRDAIVIGTGFGGITAAALLAKEGYDVLTLEAANELGGCASKFDRKGYRFSAGATVGMGFEEDGMLRMLFDELGAPIPPMRKVDEIMNVYLPDRRLTYFSEKEAWYREVIKKFDQNPDGIHAFFEDVFKVSMVLQNFVKKRAIFPPSTASEYLYLLRSIDFNFLGLTTYLTQSVEDRLSKFGLTNNQPFMAFINGQLMDSVQTTAKFTPSLLGYMALSIFHQGAFYVEGGLASIIHALADNYRASGGELRLRHQVVSVAKHGDIWTVMTKRGQVFRTRKLIMNVPIHNVFSLLEPELHSSLPIKEQKEKDRKAWGAFTLYIGAADASFMQPQISSIPFHQFISSYESPLSEGNQFLFSMSQEGDTKFAPMGKRSITISTHTNVDKWWDREKYESRKEEYMERILDSINNRFPGFSSKIDIKMAGTPVTFKRYTQRAEGKVGGYIPSGKYSLLKSYSPNSRVEGLWFCGDTVFPGAGSLGSSLSGWIVADAIMGKHPSNGM